MEDGKKMTNINILYEDNHLLVVEKPINIPVQADSSKDEDLLNILKQTLNPIIRKIAPKTQKTIHMKFSTLFFFISISLL